MAEQAEMFDKPEALPSPRVVAASMGLLASLPDVYRSMFLHLHKKLNINMHKAVSMVVSAWQQDHIIAQYESSRPKSVKSKQEFYQLFEQERFGNRQEVSHISKSKHWFGHGESQHPPFNSGHPLWALRYKKPGYRQWSCYDLPPQNVWPTYCDWVAEGADPKLFNLTPMMPDEHIVVQGEIQSTHTGWEFRLSTMKRPMNESLNAEPLRMTGVSGWLYLKLLMDPESYDDIRSILEDFPNACIEFSTYDICVGSVRGRNTIVWEVRNY